MRGSVGNAMHRSVHVEAVDARMLALMRCVLAFSAFAIIWIDPLEPRRLVGLTYGSLGLYCIYSAILALLAYRADWPPPARALHWIDVAFYAYLVALTEGTSSIFFQFFLFAILAASFSRGFREGFLVTGASVILFLTVGVLFAPAGDAFELNRTLIRGVYLFAFGYMIAYWGGYESLLKRRLRLLQEINSPWNPRLGVSHAVGSNLDRLREFYEGDSCILVLQRQSAPPAYYMQAASRQKPGAATIANPLTETAAQALLRLPRTVAAYYYHDPAGSWSMKYRGFSAYDLEAQSRARLSYAECETLANLLDARALLTVPYAQRDGTMGRIFLTAAYGGFSHSDIDFLAQVSSTIATVVENMHMMEELITQAAEHERLTISRDLHDTSIQPYIGLKLSLEALQRAAGPDSPLAQPISELVAMAGMTLRDLRDYAETLRERTPMGGEFLVAAVRRQAERLARFYGVEVEVTSKLSAQLQGRLAAEAFQMISEGLSNILRHTEAKRAFVSILCENSQLVLKIGDQVHSGARALEPFTPRSIHERSKALGGVARVDTQPDGYTVVQVTIPL